MFQLYFIKLVILHSFYSIITKGKEGEHGTLGLDEFAVFKSVQKKCAD